MQAVDRELSSGEIISRGFLLFRANFTRIVVPLLFGAVVSAALRVLFARQLSPILDQLTMFQSVPLNETNVGPALQTLGQALSISILQGFVLWIVSVPFFAIALKVAHDASTGRTSSLSESFSSAAGRMPALLSAGFIAGLIVFLGIVLVIPGLLFMIMFSMFIPSIMIENESGPSSLGRSRRLVSRRWGKVFVVGITALLISIILGIVFDGFLGLRDLYISAAVRPFYGLISDVLSVSFLAVLYQSLLRKEGMEMPPQASGGGIGSG